MLVRQREKIQKMPRCQRVVFALLSLSLPAAILPDGIEMHARKSVTPLIPEPAAVWREYGLQVAEKAEYSNPTRSFTVSAWRLPDATSALAAIQLLRPAKPPSAAIEQRGNYILQFDGYKLQEETINQLILSLPRYDSSSLPALTGFLPAPARHGNSERYILGPASLEAFLPGLSPSLVAFHFGTEGQLARYKDKDGDLTLVLFNYPNPQIAKDRLAAFQEQKQFVARRSGPLLGVVTQTPSPDAAERLLSQLRWEVNITLSQQLPDPKGDNLGVLFLNISKFSGLMVVFALLAGAAFAGFRILGRKFSGQKPGEDAAVIALHLEE
jgi:hypothetical protein